MGNESSTPVDAADTNRKSGRSAYLEFFENAGETLTGAGGVVCGSLSDTLITKAKSSSKTRSGGSSNMSDASNSLQDEDPSSTMMGSNNNNNHDPNPMSELFARAILNEVTDNPNTMKESEMAQREKQLLQKQKNKKLTPQPIPMTPRSGLDKKKNHHNQHMERHKITIGLSLSRRATDDNVGHAETVTRQTAFDLNELQDRGYKYVSSTDASGWRAGGGESGKCGQKNPSPDTVCIPLLELECEGEHMVDAVIAALARGDVFIPHMSVMPESLCVESRTSPPDLILKFGCERNEDVPPEEWPNWCLEFMHNQLYENFANCGAMWTRPFSITLAQKVRWKTVKHMNKYFRQSETVIQKWREAGPQYLEPQLSYIEGGATPEEVAKPHGIYLMRNGIPTNYFPPNLDPPYTTKMTRSLLYHVINKSWDKQKRDWTTQPIPRSVTPSMIFQTMCGQCNYPLSPHNDHHPHNPASPNMPAPAQAQFMDNHPHLAEQLNISNATQQTSNKASLSSNNNNHHRDLSSTTSSSSSNRHATPSNVNGYTHNPHTPRSRSHSPSTPKQQQQQQQQQQPDQHPPSSSTHQHNNNHHNSPQHSHSPSEKSQQSKSMSIAEDLIFQKETMDSEDDDAQSISNFEEDMALSQTQSMSVGESHTTIPIMNGIMERERTDRKKRDAERELERKKVAVLEQALQLKLLKKKEKSDKKKKKKKKEKRKEKEKKEKQQQHQQQQHQQQSEPTEDTTTPKSPPSLFHNNDESQSFSPTVTNTTTKQTKSPQYFFADDDKPTTTQKQKQQLEDQQEVKSQASLDYSLDDSTTIDQSSLMGDASLIGQQFAGDGSVVTTNTANTNTGTQSLLSAVTRTTVHDPKDDEAGQDEDDEDDISLSILESSSSIETRVPTDEELFAVGWAKAFDPNSNAYYYFTLDRSKIVWENPISESNDDNTR